MDCSKGCTLFALIGRPVHSDTNSASPGSILAMQQLRPTTKSLTFPLLSIARYSFIQMSQLGRQWRERKCPIFETEAKGIRTRAHLIASSAFYRKDTALHDDIPVKLLKDGDVKSLRCQWVDVSASVNIKLGQNVEQSLW